MPIVRHVIYGTIKENGTPKALVTFWLKNMRTLDMATLVTNASGFYAADIGNAVNFPNSFLNGDTIQLKYSNAKGDTYKTVTVNTALPGRQELSMNLIELEFSAAVGAAAVTAPESMFNISKTALTVAVSTYTMDVQTGPIELSFDASATALSAAAIEVTVSINFTPAVVARATVSIEAGNILDLSAPVVATCLCEIEVFTSGSHLFEINLPADVACVAPMALGPSTFSLEFSEQILSRNSVIVQGVEFGLVEGSVTVKAAIAGSVSVSPAVRGAVQVVYG